MSGACSAHVELRNEYNIFIGNPEGKRLLEGIRLWETDGSEALDVSV
jgi:hypothetical protein